MARMNASFPYVSPAVDPPTEPRRHVVDTGYCGNYGVRTAAAWRVHHRHWLKRNTSDVVFIQARDLPSEQRPHARAGEPGAVGAAAAVPRVGRGGQGAADAKQAGLPQAFAA
jgi:hypothetical protein